MLNTIYTAGCDATQDDVEFADRAGRWQYVFEMGSHPEAEGLAECARHLRSTGSDAAAVLAERIDAGLAENWLFIETQLTVWRNERAFRVNTTSLEQRNEIADTLAIDPAAPAEELAALLYAQPERMYGWLSPDA